ncbi:MAG: MFS transporter [Ferruginibacter sp.]|nr:MFS transporter [Ferruginibacter sp.]
MKIITRTVWLLSFVSLFTDMASEMLYPIMPIYLKSIGFSVIIIGVLEGLAEAVAGFSKGYFGNMSDNFGKRLPFVQIGYGLSALSKPLMPFFVNPLWVFFVRTTDRIGKGIRTGARDALLSEEATQSTKASVFGFHRSMDTLGAVIGPILALLFLYYYPQKYTTLFFIAFLPGCAAIAASFLIKEKIKIKQQKKIHFFSFIDYWKKATPQYRKVAIGLLAFALFNSSDIFLLLQAKQAGLSDVFVIGLYIFYNLVYALSAYPLGAIADKLGFKNILIVGFVLFGIVYLGMGVSSNKMLIFAMFFLYGLYAAATEGVAKAWLSNLCKKEETATAIGAYASFQSVFSMLSSSGAGVIWYCFGASATFILSAIATLFIVGYFLFFVKNKS